MENLISHDPFLRRVLDRLEAIYTMMPFDTAEDRWGGRMRLIAMHEAGASDAEMTDYVIGVMLTLASELR